MGVEWSCLAREGFGAKPKESVIERPSDALLQEFFERKMHHKSLESALKMPQIRWGDAALTDEHMKVVAFIIANSTKMNSLGLDQKSMSDAGAVVLSEALIATKAPLTKLFLYDNKISDAGAAALGDALRASRAPLELIDLHDNAM